MSTSLLDSLDFEGMEKRVLVAQELRIVELEAALAAAQGAIGEIQITSNVQQAALDCAARQRDEALRQVAALRDRFVLLPEVRISEQPEWDMSENNGVIWKLFLQRFCSEALSTIHLPWWQER